MEADFFAMLRKKGPGIAWREIVYLDMADWQDCTKVPPISLLPQILLLKGEAKRHRDKMKDADREKSEPKEIIKGSEEGSMCKEEK